MINTNPTNKPLNSLDYYSSHKEEGTLLADSTRVETPVHQLDEGRRQKSRRDIPPLLGVPGPPFTSNLCPPLYLGLRRIGDPPPVPGFGPRPPEKGVNPPVLSYTKSLERGELRVVLLKTYLYIRS